MANSFLWATALRYGPPLVFAFALGEDAIHHVAVALAYVFGVDVFCIVRCLVDLWRAEKSGTRLVAMPPEEFDWSEVLEENLETRKESDD